MEEILSLVRHTYYHRPISGFRLKKNEGVLSGCTSAKSADL